MLEYYEVDPLPEVCRHCIEAAGEDDCFNCDYALDRWHLTPESEERLQELKIIRREARSHKDKIFIRGGKNQNEQNLTTTVTTAAAKKETASDGQTTHHQAGLGEVYQHPNPQLYEIRA